MVGVIDDRRSKRGGGKGQEKVRADKVDGKRQIREYIHVVPI